jgi:hypothetical protein
MKHTLARLDLCNLRVSSPAVSNIVMAKARVSGLEHRYEPVQRLELKPRKVPTKSLLPLVKRREATPLFAIRVWRVVEGHCVHPPRVPAVSRMSNDASDRVERVRPVTAQGRRTDAYLRPAQAV